MVRTMVSAVLTVLIGIKFVSLGESLRTLPHFLRYMQDLDFCMCS